MKRKLLPQIIAMSRHLIIGLWVHCMLASFVLAHEGNAQNNRLKTVEVKVDWKDISLENALEEIEAQTEFHFTYEKNLIRNNIIIYGDLMMTSIQLWKGLSNLM